MYEISLMGDIALYADETSIFYSGTTITAIIQEGQHQLEKSTKKQNR